MALDNKLGLTSIAELDREEERISKKKAAQLFDRKPLMSVHLQDLRKSINICSKIFLISPAKSAQSIFQRAISVLRL